MRVSIHEDFCGIGMGRHRADLIQHLDDVLGQLDQRLRLRNYERYKSDLNKGRLQDMKRQYQQLREALLEVNTKAIARTSSYPRLYCPVC